LGFGRLRQTNVTTDAGLDGNHAHRVRDDVVQFSCDAQSFLQDRLPGAGLPLSFEHLVSFAQGAPPPGADRCAGKWRTAGRTHSRLGGGVADGGVDEQ
jgi:hypothetical protein